MYQQVLLAQYGTYDNEPSTIDKVLSFIGDWWLTALLVIIAICLVFSAIEIVHEKTACVVERLGKFNRIMHSGLNFRVPFIDKIVEEVSLQIQQVSEGVQVKTLDNVFVTLPVTVQYRVEAEHVQEAHYELEEPEAAIVTLILNEVKSTAAGMQLDSVFSSRDLLQTAVLSALETKFGEYGFVIVSVVVDNPKLSKELETSFDSVKAAELAQRAAAARAEAVKIEQIGVATANAEGLKINGAAQVAYRNTIATGYAAAVRAMTEDTGLHPSACLHQFAVTDTNDAIRDAARSGATVVIASPTHTDGLYAALAPAANGDSRHAKML